MNSAAKLRTRRGIAALGATALIATSFGPAAFAAWDAPQQGGTISSPAAEGVGIVDTSKALDLTQGATLVQAGQDNQALGDVRLVIPNSFRAGDTIDLRILDRSATETTNGRGNSGPSTKMEFAANPAAAVTGPHAVATTVAPTNDANEDTANNTEGVLNPWESAASAVAPYDTKPGVTPAFDVSTVASTGSNYKDTVRLRINTDPSTGDPNAKWVVTLSDLALNLGPQVTPGELRLVPFAYNNDNNVLVAAPAVFDGNTEYQARTQSATGPLAQERAIGIYTVPAYVAPVSVKADNLAIISDGSAQSVGAVTVAETAPYSLGNDTYTLNFDGATIANTSASQIKAAVTGGGTNEAVQVLSIADDKSSITFRLTGASETTTASIAFTGLQLRSAAAGPISVSVEGGRVGYWMTDPAGSTTSDLTDADGNVLVRGDNWFTQAGGTVPANIVNPVVTTNTVGASLTPQQAALFNPGVQTVTYSAGTSDLIVDNTGGDPVEGLAALTDAQLAALGGEGTYTLTSDAAPASATLDTTVSTVDLAMTDAGAMDLLEAAGETLTGDDTFTYNVIWTSTADGDYWIISTDADPTTTVDNWGYSRDGVNFYSSGDPATRAVGGTPVLTLTEAAPASSGTIVIDLTAADPATLWTLATPSGNWTSTDGTTFTPPTGVNGGATVAVGSPVTGTGAFTVAQDVDNTDGTLTYAPAEWTLVADVVGADVPVTYVSDNGVTFNRDTGEPTTAPATITFSEALDATDGQFEIIAGPLNAAGTINQLDIEAPTDELVEVGTASAGLARIGGSNRFGTAARIAERFVKDSGANTADTAIIVNGLAAPDALSASFLAQREGAPILLTAPNQLPSETVSALRNLGVRKVYIVGGRAAVGEPVFNALREQDAYMWDTSAGAVVPRGDKLEVVQLGGASRYDTNWRVNTYAAAQTANRAPIGQIAVGEGQSLKTTGMLARSFTDNDFADALTASVLSAGRAGGLEVKRDAGVTNLVNVSTGSFTLLNAADAAKLTRGQYRLVGSAADGTANVEFTNTAGETSVVGTWTPNNLTIGDQAYALAGVAASGNVFTVAENPEAGAVYGYDSTVAKVNALPVILTQPTTLVQQARDQMRAFDLQHMLLIGGNSALAPAVNDQVAAVGATSHRIGGKDRYETAANVNRFAMNPETASADNPVPGLGFDGNHVYADADRTERAGGEMVAYLANGLKFPDALVAGPWISRERNAMVMTQQGDLPAPTAEFISEKAAQLDRAAALGQGAAVSSSVLVEANRLAATR